MTSPEPALPAAVRRRMEATLSHYQLLGSEPVVEALATFRVDPDRPDVWDANHLRHARAATPEQIDDLLARADQVYAGQHHRRVVIDVDTPDALEARLALDGWTLDPTLQHLLPADQELARSLTSGENRGDTITIEPVETDNDWRTLVTLTRSDHLEEAAKAGREPWDTALTEDMVGLRRRKAPEVQPWVAAFDGDVVGMFSSMPGVEGVGLVEDLFVEPRARGRGVALALIAHAVADARARGAGPVIIGSLPDDWPKRLYTRLGFRPVFLERIWNLDLRTPPQV